MTDDSIGVDIAKDRLDAVRLSDGGSRSFSNDARGFQTLRTWLRAAPPARVVYESTGPYHSAVVVVRLGCHLSRSMIHSTSGAGTKRQLRRGPAMTLR